MPKELTSCVSRRAQHGMRYVYFLLGCRRYVRNDLDQGRHLPDVGGWRRQSPQGKCTVILNWSVVVSRTINPVPENLLFS